MAISFPDIPEGDDVRISASTYVMYKQCPEQANAKMQSKYGPDSRPAFSGSLAHLVFSRHLTSGPINAEDFVQVCREEIGNSSLNHRMAGLEMRPSSLTSLIEEVRDLYERFTRFPEDGFEGSEVRIESEPSPGVLLLGSIDAVFSEELGGHRLVDWKTGELGSSDDQLLFYSLLWALEKKEIPELVEAVSVRTGERYSKSPTSADLEGIAEAVGRMIEAIRAAWAADVGLPRSGGPWCTYCPLLEDCAEGKSVEALLT